MTPICDALYGLHCPLHAVASAKGITRFSSENHTLVQWMDVAHCIELLDNPRHFVSDSM